MSKSKAGNNGKRKQKKIKGDSQSMTFEEFGAMQMESRIQLILQLIPLGLMAIQDILEQEVLSLCGPKYSRKSDATLAFRHGTNPGTVRLLDQRVPVKVPRIRSRKNKEIPLTSYEQFHKGLDVDESLLRRVLYGVSCRNYEKAAESIPGAIGLSGSSVSKKFKKESSKLLKQLQERDLSEHDIVAIFLDGKSFGENMMVIALGVTITGEKIILGFVESGTENGKVIKEFLLDLKDNRGLDISQGVLTVLDGSKGLLSGVRQAFGKLAVIQRCQWHKRENVISYLPKDEQTWMRKRLQTAYNKPTYAEAKRALNKIKSDLSDRNQSAESSLEEGFEETLTLHKLGVFALLGSSFKTTNCLESINSQAEAMCGKVDRWMNSNQRQRWLAAALNDIEERFHRVRGYRHLGRLREALVQQIFGAKEERRQRQVAA